LANTATVSIGQHSESGLKESNEDSFGILIPDEPLLTTKGIAMVVADGMSGSEAAKEASESCVKSFLTDYFSTSESWTVKTSAHNILTALNRWLYGQGYAQHGSNRGMVGTLSALILKSGTAHIFHVGDTRISRLRGDKLEPLTNEHRLPGRGDKEYLSRAMGIDLNVEIDYQSVAVEAEDIFVFTTDGVHDFVPSKLMAAQIKSGYKDLNAAASGLVESALSNGSNDNLTCQIVRVDEVGQADIDSHTRKLQELPFPPELSPGMILDGYKIQRELHASSRSQVYLALDQETGNTVAIKTPSVNYADDPLYLERFHREEWTGKRINSPYVLRVYENERPKKFLYYVTEHIEGQTLGQWMRDNPHPDLTAVRDIIGQIAKGLRAFHRKEMIHQDLKPDNILIDAFGTVKIIDFGSAKIAGIEELALPIGDTGHPGTKCYSAPEFVAESGGAMIGSRRSDRFSLGVIAYEMLTGKLPYGEGFSSKRSINKLSYQSARDHNPQIPDWIDGALKKAINPDPQHRYDSLSAFLGDLVTPNPKFVVQEKRPLLERNPAGFWRSAALLLLALNTFLIFMLQN